MEILFAILPALLISVLVPLILQWIYGQSKKEKAESGFISRTRFPRRFTLSSIIALTATIILLLAGTVLLCIFDPDTPASTWIALILVMIFIIAIPLLLVLIALRTYEVIREDGILIKRLTKTKLVKYSEMVSYRYSMNQLLVYDEQHQPLFFVGDNRVGMDLILKQLDNLGVDKE